MQDIIGMIRKIYRFGIEIIRIMEPVRWMDEKVSGVKGRLSGRIDNLYLKLKCITLILTPDAN